MPRTPRTILLVKLLKTDDEGDDAPAALTSVSLGTYRQVLRQLEPYNTGPDGSKNPENIGVLYGPGLTVQMPMVGPDDPVMQVAVSLTEEDIAFPVLSRICRGLGWKLMDPTSGRTFGV